MNASMTSHATDTDRHAGGARYRAVAVAQGDAEIRRDADGTWRLHAREALGAYPDRLTDCLVRGAQAHPDRVLAACRGEDGRWIEITYAQMLERARALGQGLADLGLSAERPLAVLSGNDLEHLQLMFAAMLAGVPYAPISPAYSLVSTDYGKLRHTLGVLRPGAVFVADAGAFARALDAALPADATLIVAQGGAAGTAHTRDAVPFERLLGTAPRTIDLIHETIGPDHIAKILFTSGSTKRPKAVPTTHRMLCSNQQMLRQTMPELTREPPVLVDWLPWNHTFGGSHNLGIALYNGGTLYLDDGRPVPGRFDETVRNLREIAPTIYFNVPKGWEELTAALERDAALRDTFFSRVKLYFFGGAGLSQAAWDRLDRVTEAHCGERIRIMAGLGMTETSPSCLFTTGPLMRSGYIGLPAPGCDVKLAPCGGKLELRFKGPNVMRGYWHADVDPRDVFDDEGYYRSGDAAVFADPARPEFGLQFDGRLTEDFKLSTGTFVSVGPLRAQAVSSGAPYVQDVVVTGLNRDDIGMLVFPRLDACRVLAGLDRDAPAADVLRAPAVRAAFADWLARLNRGATGSSTFVAHIRVMETPPSLDLGEVTDKGSLNQAAVQQHRAAAIDALHDPARPDPDVIHA
ncbi:feruloyl-CoA synthase [Burkholderia stagnalis]|uniref:feruloyl-CoA synthase n=1 Tax=Burkholderia stagnalis TaxID=1503054 RepID=UPI000F58ADDE|nr:feruloyl-CoA synthase [Burkholderia stagnalis]RQQ23739.1 feruloyl-CoA synthase [Burkholderia stagnalis]RQQ26234.1 feruloyl-CoA synthase [Burkholderia stagnalis]RQQ44681.1 feruloyl-CoA synthase [Burkholderia stagnalis]RQX91630.1 feruloyl-CoA synthase [Burkholderia stagnalis]RQY07762.1 feruloyl-CoA synthase [Burkholderia stagnalis]